MKNCLFLNVVLMILLIGLCGIGCGDGSDGDSGDTDSDTDSDTDTDADTDSDSDTDTDTDTDTDADTDTDTGTGYDGECEPEDIQVQRIYDDIEYLSSDDCAGRWPGTEGNELALEYVEDIYEAAGLIPMGDSGTYRQEFNTDQFQLDGEPTLKISNENLEHTVDYRVVHGSGSGQISGELVFVGKGYVIPPYDRALYPNCPFKTDGYNDFLTRGDLRNKVVLILQEDSTDVLKSCPVDSDQDQLGFKAMHAVKQGASAVLFAEKNPHYRFGHPGQVVAEKYYQSDLPAVFLSFEKLEAVLQRLGDSGAITTELSLKNNRLRAVTHNLLGSIEGVDPLLKDEVVIVGGHIDHIGTQGSTIYPGADDNASGTAVVNELIRVFVECDFQPKRTIMFAAWNAEEQGLVGSWHYVANPVYPLGNTIAYLNLDMEGQGDLNKVTLYDANAWLEDLVIDSTEAAGLPYTFETGPMEWQNSSDHAPFRNYGVSALFQMSGSGVYNHDYTHEPQDNISNISTDSLKSSADVALVSFIALAMGASN